jgi:formylglycine-generating enzyme required for sulfatase activity
MSTDEDVIGVANERIELVQVPGGEFLMGSANGLELERPPHRVTIGRPFRIGGVPVTQAQWRAVMGTDPSEFRGDDRLPVEGVSWDDATAFCAALSRLAGRTVRLPTEAEWEYACRAGTTTEFFFGEAEDALPEYAWFHLNSGGRTHPVGAKRPNPWGLFDMAGNVWEWCADVWHSDYTGAPADGSAWREREDQQPRRCLRGGSWNFDGFRCRSAYRSREWKEFATNHFGFRVVVP